MSFERVWVALAHIVLEVMSNPTDVFPESPIGARLVAAVEADDWNAVATIIEAEWGELITLDGRLLKQVLRALPTEVLAERPRLGLAVNYVSYLPVDGQTRTEIFRTAAPVSAPANLLDALAELTSRGAARRSAGEFDRALEAARTAIALVEQASDEQLENLQMALPELQYQWGLSLVFSGAWDDAVRQFTESHDRAEMVGNLPIRAQSAGWIALIHALSGRTADSQRWLARVSPATGASWESRAATPAILAQALLQIHDLDTTAAESTLGRLGPVTEAPEYWVIRLYVEALATTGRSESVEILARIDSAVRDRPTALATTGINDGLMRLARAKAFVKTDNLARARRQLASGSGAFFPGAHRVVAARLATLAGDHDAARELLEHFADDSAGLPRFRAEGFFLSAVVRAAAGAVDDATVDFRQAILIAETERVFSALATLTADHLEGLTATTGITPPRFENLRAAAALNPVQAITPLTQQELAVLTAISTAGSMKGAAEQLYISLNTAKSHVRRIYLKLGANSKEEALSIARRYGILSREPASETD